MWDLFLEDNHTWPILLGFVWLGDEKVGDKKDFNFPLVCLVGRWKSKGVENSFV